MKKPSILLILILCLALLPINVSAAAASSTYEDYAVSLSKLGVFVGTGDGFELDRTPTRLEGLIMLIRLLGAEKEADAMKSKSQPFTDVPKWATGYVAYAYENNLTNGLNKMTFGSSNKMDAKAYMTFLLRSLGYNDQAGDFSYANALAFSNNIGLISDSTYSSLKNAIFLRAHVAKVSFDALKFPYKGGETILVDKLMSENKIQNVIGEAFKKTELSEPQPLVIKKSGDITVKDNLESVVMLECCGKYTDKEEPDIGSGVIISSDGKIVTNYHVIEDINQITVTFNDETVYKDKVYVLDYDKDLDLAIIKINKTGLKPAVIGDSASAKAGDEIITIGSPYGYRNTITEGIVSAVRSDNIQISAAINPGSSGGGLFDQNGRLIGITNCMLYSAENMGFAVPISQLSAVAGNENILLSDFYAKTSKPLPPAPTGLKVVYETATTVMLNWNPVAGAVQYDVYCKEDGEDDYYWIDYSDYGKNYSYLAVDLKPGKKYSFKVTSENEEDESDFSTDVTLIKSSGSRSYGSFQPFYSSYPGIPDFGKLADIVPSNKGTDQFDYIVGEVNGTAFIDFVYLLIDNGFEFQSSVHKADGSMNNNYKNDDTGETISLSLKETKDNYMLSIKITKTTK